MGKIVKQVNKKKKILIRIGSLRHGGAEKVLVTFLKNLPKDKYDIDLLLNLKSGKYLKDVPSWIPIYHLHKGEMIITNKPWEIPIKAYRRSYEEILKLFPKLLYKFILKKQDYDIELIANHRLLEEVLKSPIKSSKKVVWVHNDLFSISDYTPKRLKNFFKANEIWVISDKIKSGFEKLASTKEDLDKINKIYNPIDAEEIINKSKEQINYNFKKEEGEKIFVAVGTVTPQKGFDRLIKVHKKILNEGFKHKIYIVGDGYFKDLLSLIKSLKVEETVTLVGYQENPYPFFKNSDYFILSSRYEGYPTVLFEALTLKKPIIATDVSGVNEILENGKLGKIVENSEEGIYKGMKEFLTNTNIPCKYIEEMNNNDLPFMLKNAVNHLSNSLDNL